MDREGGTNREWRGREDSFIIRGFRRQHKNMIGAQRARSILKCKYIGGFGLEVARLIYSIRIDQ